MEMHSFAQIFFFFFFIYLLKYGIPESVLYEQNYVNG